MCVCEAILPRRLNLLYLKRVNQMKEVNNVEISNLPNKEFKVKITKMLNQLSKRMDEHSEKFNRVKRRIKQN